MAWRWNGDKPRLEPMLSKRHDAIWCHSWHEWHQMVSWSLISIGLKSHGMTLKAFRYTGLHRNLHQFFLHSLVPGRYGCNFKSLIFKLIIQKSSWATHCGIALRRMPQKPANGKSTLVQGMAWCHKASSHFLNQCWPRSMWPYAITRPQRVKDSTPKNWPWQKCYWAWSVQVTLCH